MNKKVSEKYPVKGLTRLVLMYDENYKRESLGYMCSKCFEKMHGLGAIHKGDCEISDYQGCYTVIGPLIVERIKKDSKKHGEDYKSELIPISLKDLHSQLPGDIAIT